MRIKPLKITAIGLSDIGHVRHNNEDVWAQQPDIRFYVIADGMGGHQAGEVAAREAVNFLCQSVTKNLHIDDEDHTLEEARHVIIEAIEEVNTVVYKMSRKVPELRGMGTTLCCLLFHPKGLVYAHVGDSRIYRLRNEKLFQMTKDHSLMRELIDLGQLPEKHTGEFMYKNIITKAIGTEPAVEPSVRLSTLMPGDIYLMCTDGLSDMLSKDDMEAILISDNNLQRQASKLVEAAKEKGGHDNITLVMAKVEDEQKDLSR